ncbi:Oidioi.mRNA.OKI2018_I69.XSR.g16385.t1.cds [Oikopleura dioica]|uniref:Oidioi.mRNA.OKI2018_I69.XSR.g16385.t1.cds n=1 Tax=Oikopleura dioica TaxID=34765 RepID=A0ABN7SGG1_OIKDI|nr:Oidioi.mRNA.OKI2018_I69.XSR.g16385.t1.cds [Oikopleura dioica]
MGERLTWQRGREEAPKSSIPSKFENGEKAEKIGFLYNQQETDREQYLTGKKVDKAFDDYLDREKRNFENSLNPYKEGGKDREIDVDYKSKEDPLSYLKEKEQEKFKQLQANPQKMARLQKLMKAYLGNQEEESSSSSSEDERKADAPEKSSSESTEKYESKFKNQYKPHSYQRKLKQGFSNKMTAEEKQRKIDEMMGNASKNDADRAERVKKTRAVEEKEEKEFEANRNDHSYYRDLKMKATEKSLEERVRARRDRNQRTSAALDKNWTKR